MEAAVLSPQSKKRPSVGHQFFRWVVFGLLPILPVFPVLGQEAIQSPPVPRNFTLDLETAARLRPQLMEQSIPASGDYAIGLRTLNRLVQQIARPAPVNLQWDLRLVPDDQFNAYSSPDGTIYVETGLARLAGESAGLWAAILSHEIAHVIRRDWARRYIYQKSLESSASVTLGEPGLPASGAESHWSDSRTAAENFARFCRQLEIEADREGLNLMARAGYHPDFVPALHHLLHAQTSKSTPDPTTAMHPCWEERDHELNRAYVVADIDFEHRWLDWYASPGGNPPTLVFAEPPVVRKAGVNAKTGAKEWELLVPIRCENLVGAVEVVLQADSPRNGVPTAATRQITGCTSPRTTISFTLTREDSGDANNREPWTEVYILDASGAVLARADIPKLPR